MAEITLEKLTKVYGDGTRAVSELDLEITDGEFVVLVGPSGCGKTSALRMIAGLEPITEGRVVIGGEVVNKLPPKDRDIAMIFQNYALYPHMSAFDNMAFGIKLRGMKKDRRGERVNGAAKTLGLDEALPKKPRTLSNDNVVARFGDNALEVDERVLLKRPGLVAFEGKRIILGVRPEDLEDAAFSGEAPAGRRLSAQVDIREDMGSEVYIHFAVAG